jgi:microcystin degradation protein MlrC
MPWFYDGVKLMKRKRVLVAGLFHETHSFLEGYTQLEDFEIRRGEELLGAAGDTSPMAGVLATAQEDDWTVVPAVDMRATPGPLVEDRAVEFFWNVLKPAAELSSGSNLDGIFLVLHGAMVSNSIDDVEGEILRRLRSLPGCSGTPLCGILDLHANVTLQMVQHSDALVAYRENPHTDAREAARNASRLLTRLMRTGEQVKTIWEHPAVMWPPTGTATAEEPMRSLERLAREIEESKPEILAVNVFAGFAFADIRETGVSFTATTLGEPEAARAELRRLGALAEKNREFGNVIDPPSADVFSSLSGHERGPIILVEPSDNIGAGAPGSGTGILNGLVEHAVKNAAVVINDPAAVAALATKRKGEFTILSIGGKGSSMYTGPVELNVELLYTSDGRFDLEDSQSHLAAMFGTHIDMGPCAVVRHKGICILLTSRRTPPFDLGQLRSQGIEPKDMFVIGVKAAVAHRRAYDRIARASYTLDTPGPCSSNLRSFLYRKVKRPIYPLDVT